MHMTTQPTPCPVCGQPSPAGGLCMTCVWQDRKGNSVNEELKPCPFCGETPLLQISLPGMAKNLTIYETKSGFFFFKEKNTDGPAIKRIIVIGCNKSREDIIHFLDSVRRNFCILNCEITDYCV